MICWRCGAGLGATGGLTISKFVGLWVCVRCRRFEDLIPATAEPPIDTGSVAPALDDAAQLGLFGPDVENPKP